MSYGDLCGIGLMPVAIVPPESPQADVDRAASLDAAERRARATYVVASAEVSRLPVRVVVPAGVRHRGAESGIEDK